MKRFAIYTYHFKDAPMMGDVFNQGEKKTNDNSDDARQKKFETLFGEADSDFNMTRVNAKNLKDEYPCLVMVHLQEFAMLRSEKPKQVTVWDKDVSSQGKRPNINRRKVPSNPYNYILIDFRSGHNMIAFEVETSGWRNLDDLASLLKDNVNKRLEKLSIPFMIEIIPEVLCLDFVEHSRWLIKKKKIAVTKMTVYLSKGLINPKVEEIIKQDAYLKDLSKRMFESDNAEITYNYPNGLRILDGRTKMLEHFVTLIGSEPNGAFRLRMSYEDGNTFVCGKDVRMEFKMSDDTFFTLFGIVNLFPEQSIGVWFDDVANEIKKQKNANTTK